MNKISSPANKQNMKKKINAYQILVNKNHNKKELDMIMLLCTYQGLVDSEIIE